MRKMVYAAGGSRKTPPDVLLLMRRVAGRLAQRGLLLRTGGAEGADRAFWEGALSQGGKIELYLPWPGFGGLKGVLERPRSEAYRIAQAYHPAWERLSPRVRALMAQNVHVLLGGDLGSPAAFFACWTPGGEVVGGTGHAIRVALAHGIPVVNLAHGRRPLEEIANLLGE